MKITKEYYKNKQKINRENNLMDKRILKEDMEEIDIKISLKIINKD